MAKKNKFIHSDIGYNYRLTNIQAAIGCAQLTNFNKIIKAKRAIADRYKKYLINEDYFILPSTGNGFYNVYWMYLIILEDHYISERSFIMKQLSKYGIETREGFVSATLQTSFKKLNMEINSTKCVQAEKASFNSFYLPSSVSLKLSEQKYICKVLNNIMNSISN